MWTYEDKRVNEGDAWTDKNGTQHPANWSVWSDEEKRAAGLVWVSQTEPPDQRFYWCTPNTDGSWAVTPKDIVILKQDWVHTIKKMANDYLALTDWEFIAKAERNREISDKTKTFRSDVLSVCNTIENDINACSTIEELIPVINNIGNLWPKN